MRIKLLTLVCLLPVFVFTQIKIDTVKSHDRPEELYFPVIRHTKPSVALRINNYLQSNILGNTTKKTASGKLFDRRKYIMNDSVTQSGITYCDFTQTLNNTKLLTIEIQLGYMAAYPSGSTEYFNFNAQNGGSIFVQDLFTNAGLEALKKKINTERIKLIKAYVEDIKREKTEELIDDLDYIAERLQDCLQYDTLEGFILTKNKMIFHKSNCFPHVMQSYMPDLDIGLTYSEVSSWLNDYGKKALLMNNASIEKEFKPGIMKPFYGSIGGKYPIVLQFTHVYNDGSLGGFYYYESQGICISLSGSMKGNDIFIEDEHEDGNTNGTFKGTYDGKQITGTWTASKTGKALPFTLKN